VGSLELVRDQRVDGVSGHQHVEQRLAADRLDVDRLQEREGHLYQIAVTPVYVESISGQALLNVLVAGYAIDALVAHEFKRSTAAASSCFSPEGG